MLRDYFLTGLVIRRTLRRGAASETLMSRCPPRGDHAAMMREVMGMDQAGRRPKGAKDQKGAKMRVGWAGALLLLGGCAYSNYMSRVDDSSYTATLASAPPLEGSPVRVVVGPTVKYSRAVSWDDIGHAYRMSGSVEDSDGISIEVFNQSDTVLQIDWERSSLVDAAGHPRRIIHSGVNPGAASEPQAPTFVGGRSRISEIIYPADGIVLEHGAWHHQIYLPTPGLDSAAAQLSLVLGVVIDGFLHPVSEPISVHVTGTATTSKSGDKWPRFGNACQPLIGCAEGLICIASSSDFKCADGSP